MTLDDVVKMIDDLLKDDHINMDDWEMGYSAALKYLRQEITGDICGN